jgi:hypothetical protein
VAATFIVARGDTMTDPTGTGPEHAPQPDDAPWPAPAPEATAPDAAAPEVAAPEVAASDAAAPGAAPVPPPPPPPGAAAPGWYPDPAGTRPDIVRYWDGTAWTDRWTQGDKGRARFGEKYRRRLPLTIIVVGLLNMLTALPRLFSSALFPTSTTIAVVLAIVSIGAVFVAGLIWNLVVAAFPGEPTDALKPRRVPHPWVWACVVAVVAGPLSAWSLYRPATVAAVTISSPAEACQQFLAVNVEAAQKKTKVIGMAPYYQSLADASRTSDPTFSSEMQKVADSPSNDTLKAATTAVITRCISEGNLTRDQVTAWVAQLRAAG